MPYDLGAHSSHFRVLDLIVRVQLLIEATFLLRSSQLDKLQGYTKNKTKNDYDIIYCDNHSL